MEDYGDSGIVVTVKIPESSKWAKDDPWLVFRGNTAEQVKVKIAEAFGVDHEGLLLIDVTVNAQRVASSMTKVIAGFGGKVLKQSKDGDEEPRKGSVEEATSGDVWAKVDDKPKAKPASKKKDEDAPDPILSAIEHAKTRDELKKIWAQNQALFSEKPEYMAAWKAKGKSLS